MIHEQTGLTQWFGNSHVKDDQGKPLLTYHASPKRFSQFNGGTRGNFFSNCLETVHQYGANVYSVYLRLENPYITDFDGALWCDGDGDFLCIDDLVEYAQRSGYDGVIAYNVNRMGENEYVAFAPDQIRHAHGQPSIN